MKKGQQLDLEKIIGSKDKIENDYPIIYEKMLEPKFKIKDLKLSARVANHWEEKDLFFNTTQKSKLNVFNLIDSVWIKIMIQLRAFNVPLETLKYLKDNFIFSFNDIIESPENNIVNETIFALAGEENKKEVGIIMKSSEYKKALENLKINILELFIMDLLLLQNDYRFLINSKGDFLPFKENCYNEISELIEFKEFIKSTHISISLPEILKDLIGEVEIDNIKAEINDLTEIETEIITAIREDNIKSVEIIFSGKTKKAEIIKITKENSLNESLKLKELIFSGGYQDLKITTENGKIVHTTSTRKIKIKVSENLS
jgi:hypothetical protein